jgi:hypothetical protein
MAAQACNLSTWDAEAGESWFEDSLGCTARTCLKKIQTNENGNHYKQPQKPVGSTV